MPALKITGCCGSKGRLTTRPFAGDDLQVPCLITFIYRIIQMACILPFWVRLFLYRLHGKNFVGPSGRPSWCNDVVDPITAIYISTTNIDDTIVEGESIGLEWSDNKGKKAMVLPLTFYLIVSVIYNALDIALSLGIWSAASVGTPTHDRGRNKALRTIIWIKLLFMNCLLVLVLTSGIYLIAEGRRTNYGCGEGDDIVETFESSAWYAMLCLVIFTYAFELLFWPSLILNHVGQSLVAETKRSRLFRERRHHDTAACLGCCVKTGQILTCNRFGGGKIRAQNDLKDAAIALMDFMNLENTNFDIVLSDIWLAFKLLKRIQREKKFKLSEQARMDNEQEHGRDMEGGQLAHLPRGPSDNNNSHGVVRYQHKIFDAEDKLLQEYTKQYNSPLSGESMDAIDASVTYKPTTATTKTVLRHTVASDVEHLRVMAHYCNYAYGVYDLYRDALLAEGLLVGGRSGLYHPTLDTENVSLSSCFQLADFELPESSIVYATFDNDILSTPYCVIVDTKERTVVVAIVGSATLEDMVTDLQFSSVKLDHIAQVCGFEGNDMYCHRGILSKCKWVYNDLTKRKILSRLIPPSDAHNKNNPCHGYNLVFTGHSLGASIAAILGTMYRPLYPNVKCHIYCPPGCSVSLNLAIYCKEYVTSIVVGNDIIPRIRDGNFEILRLEFLEILARVRVPKIEAWRALRRPCANRQLEAQNMRLLHSRDTIPVSDYSFELNSFQTNRMRTFDEISPVDARLNIPGNIIHLVHAMDASGTYVNKFVPYWESLRSLREIELSTAAMMEHSIMNLASILKNLAASYDNAANGTLDDEGDLYASIGSIEPEEPLDDFYYDYENSADDRWFILCSQPNGITALIPTLLAVAGFICSILGNNTCSLFIRELVTGEGEVRFRAPDGASGYVSGMAMGLYSYGVEYHNEDVGDVKLQCSPSIPEDITLDAYVKIARGFSALALLVGLPVICFLGLTSCMRFSRAAFCRFAVLLFFITTCQAMVFIFHMSSVCNTTDQLLQEFPQSYLETCSIYNGSKLSISATVLWFLASVSTAYLDRTRLVEDHLKLLSMQALANTNTQER